MQNIFSVNQRTYQRKFAPAVERSSLLTTGQPRTVLCSGSGGASIKYD